MVRLLFGILGAEGYRGVKQFRQPLQFRFRSGNNRPAAGVEHRTFGLLEEGRRFFNVPFGKGFPSAPFDKPFRLPGQFTALFLVRLPFRQGGGNVFGYVD